MKNIRLGTGFLVFILFFGIALLEAIRNQNWLMSGFWVLIGLAFIVADNMKKKKKET